MVHVMQNNVPLDIILFQAPNVSQNGLWTYGTYANDTWRVTNRMTLNLGLRFDRYRAFLPDQVHAAGKYNPIEIPFAAKDSVIDSNLFAPRLGVTYDLAGTGKTVVKFNYGKYWYNPGADFLFNVNENSNAWWRRYRWTDANRDGRYNPGEEGTLVSSRGGVAQESLDPNLENTRTDEIATFLEHELMAKVGIRAGYVWRGVRNNYARINAAQPFEGFSVPVSVPDSGSGRPRRHGRRRASDCRVRSGAAVSRADADQHDDQRPRRAMAISTPSKSPAPSA